MSSLSLQEEGNHIVESQHNTKLRFIQATRGGSYELRIIVCHDLTGSYSPDVGLQLTDFGVGMERTGRVRAVR